MVINQIAVFSALLFLLVLSFICLFYNKKIKSYEKKVREMETTIEDLKTKILVEGF